MMIVRRMGTIRKTELLEVMRDVYIWDPLSLDFDIHEHEYGALHG